MSVYYFLILCVYGESAETVYTSKLIKPSNIAGKFTGCKKQSCKGPAERQDSLSMYVCAILPLWPQNNRQSF